MAILKSPFSLPANPNRLSILSRSSLTDQSHPAISYKRRLLTLVSDQNRGLATQNNPSKLSEIVQAIDDLAAYGKDVVTTGSDLSATWRLMWTTEKEQLFIIEKAYLFGTKTGDVLQVIDVEKGVLNNVITFPPDGVFFVRSTIEVASSQRVNFRFTSAVLRGENWELPLPPFGQGCFRYRVLYMDYSDIHGDGVVFFVVELILVFETGWLV